MAQLLLAASAPARLTIALEAIEPLAAHARAIEHQWQLRLERARYEAEQAQRRYQAVEPAPRVVARSVERDWNETLTVLDQLERDSTAIAPGAARQVSEAERQRIVA